MRPLCLFLIVAGCALAQPVPREQCFPIELLPEEDRQPAEALFLKLLDSEALYTVIGGVKPMSSGFSFFRVSAAATEAEAVDDARRYLEHFRCGTELSATIHHFARPYPDDKTKQLMRYFDGVVFHRTGMRRALHAHRAFFGPVGLTQHTAPMEVLMTIEHTDGPSRQRGYGYLFGYPDYAVGFFNSAEIKQTLTGKFVERDFVSMPTFAREERGVVYAIPKGRLEGEADHALREKLAAILKEYKERRQKYIGDGLPGVVAMLRDWFCSDDACSIP